MRGDFWVGWERVVSEALEIGRIVMYQVLRRKDLYRHEVTR